MAVNSPDQMQAEFAKVFNAGDADALLAFYERTATIEPQPGQLVSGLDDIREALGGFLALKGTIQLQTTKVVEAGDLALIHGSWTLEGTGPDGNPLSLSGESTEVLRRQSDGTWLFAIDLPSDE